MTATTDSDFSDLLEQLDTILDTVKQKDTGIESCLDLLDEAMKLGMEAVEIIDADSYAEAENDEKGFSSTTTPSQVRTISDPVT